MKAFLQTRGHDKAIWLLRMCDEHIINSPVCRFESQTLVTTIPFDEVIDLIRNSMNDSTLTRMLCEDGFDCRDKFRESVVDSLETHSSYVLLVDRTILNREGTVDRNISHLFRVEPDRFTKEVFVQNRCAHHQYFFSHRQIIVLQELTNEHWLESHCRVVFKSIILENVFSVLLSCM